MELVAFHSCRALLGMSTQSRKVPLQGTPPCADSRLMTLSIDCKLQPHAISSVPQLPKGSATWALACSYLVLCLLSLLSSSSWTRSLRRTT
eukprot:3707601-Amphidinium_carterae.1